MKKRLIFFLALNIVATSLYAQTGNTGIGTTSPTTKLDVNGAITTREGTAIAVSGTAVTVPDLAFSQYRLTGAPTADFTITGPTTSDGSLALVAGARLILVNTTTQIGSLNGSSILPGAAQEFAFTNGSWVGTNNGGQPDYDWMKAGNLFPTAAGDTSANIYHIGGRVGVGTATPVSTMHVVATADTSNILSDNIVATFDPFGGQDVAKPASILVNGGRAIFGYDLAADGSKYAFIRGNQSTDIRLQAMDANEVLYPKALFISSRTPGFVGINNDAPQSQLDIRGTTRIFAGTGIQSGSAYNGTSNYNGFEVITNLTTGDAWVGIQRGGTGPPLNIGKPVGTLADSPMVRFHVGGPAVGSITYNGSGVAYNVNSDFRLKENIRASQYGLSTIKQMEVYDYNFKTNKEKDISTGLMAQELYKLYPQAVKVGSEDVKTDPWMVDYSKLAPVLIKAVQELSGKIETLEQALQEKNQQITELQKNLKSVAQLTEEVNKIKQSISKNK